MPVKAALSLLSLIAALAGVTPYIRGMIKGETRPHMFSWLIWGLASGICGTVQLAEGGGPGSWLLILNNLYCAGVVVASLWIGTHDIKKIDGVILAITLSTIPLWLITKNPLWSVLILVMIDGLAYIPTIRKSWTKPYEESALAWALSSIVFSCSLIAMENYKITTCLYPATFIVVNAGFAVFLLIRRHRMGQSDASHRNQG